MPAYRRDPYGPACRQCRTKPVLPCAENIRAAPVREIFRLVRLKCLKRRHGAELAAGVLVCRRAVASRPAARTLRIIKDVGDLKCIHKFGWLFPGGETPAL